LAGFVRTALTISAIAHALLWVLLALPGPAPLARPAENPIVVDIVSPDEIGEAPKAQVPDKATTPETSTSERPEPQPSPPPQRQDQAQPRQQTPRPEAEPAPSASAPQAAQAAQAASKPEQRQPGSSWLDTALSSPLVTASAFDAAERPANLSQTEIATFKAHLRECWNPPAGLADAQHLVVVLRVSLKPNGALAAEPTMLAASASSDGPALMQAAMRALRQCQPFGFLPAAKYKEWKVLDLSFSPTGLRALPVF
jgi:outer membrane biosynthesis protein TonB